MKTITLVPGSAEWLQSRSASKAAAVMGQDAHTSRNELLRMMATGIGKEFSDWQQKHLLDKGHASEVGAIRYAEELLDDALSPVCGATDDGYLTANFDGLTFCGKKGVEAKAWNEKLAAAVLAGEVPDTHWPQLEQHIIVGNLDFVLFVVGDGTPEKTVSIEYRAVPGRAERLIAAWRQFDEDLANYEHVEVIPAAVGATIKELPALAVQIDGRVISSNLVAFKSAALEFIGNIKTDLQTDQDFADAKKTVTFCKDGEERLELVKAQALAQTASIDELFRTVDEISAKLKETRLLLDKTVKARNDALRVEIVGEGRTKFAEHVAALNARIGKPYMPAIAADFAAAIKGKSSFQKMREAVADLLAAKKIEANEIAAKIEANMTLLRELAADHKGLFADAAQLVLKDSDACEAIIKSRIAEHKAEEERKLEAERQRIRAEEEAKARTEAEAKLKAEQEAEQAEFNRQQGLREAEAVRVALAAEAAQNAAKPPAHAVQAPTGGQPQEAAVAAPTLAQVLHAAAPAAVANVIAPIDNGAKIKLGEIGERLGFALTADFLASLGFQPAETVKAAKLYREQDFPAICGALVRHIQTVAQQPMQKAA